LQLKIAESVFLKHADLAGTLYRQMWELGVKIAFDDFGTGYSFFSYRCGMYTCGGRVLILTTSKAGTA
jgi:EAL domain-containing protein (putative c-di-GMP-specific phosphodiesterase class I)